MKDIVFTNGCFDIIHRGHIELLTYCKSIGRKVKPELTKVVNLKASQNEIDGNKVSKFLNQLQNGDVDSEFTENLKKPIIVS